MKKGHMLPYLDNKFLLVTRTRQDSKEIILDCLSFFGECFWKTLKKEIWIYNFGHLFFCHFSEFLEKKKRMSHSTTCRQDIHKRILYNQFWLNLLVDDFFSILATSQKWTKKKPWCQMKPKFATLLNARRYFQYTFYDRTRTTTLQINLK